MVSDEKKVEGISESNLQVKLVAAEATLEWVPRMPGTHEISITYRWHLKIFHLPLLVALAPT